MSGLPANQANRTAPRLNVCTPAWSSRNMCDIFTDWIELDLLYGVEFKIFCTFPVYSEYLIRYSYKICSRSRILLLMVVTIWIQCSKVNQTKRLLMLFHFIILKNLPNKRVDACGFISGSSFWLQWLSATRKACDWPQPPQSEWWNCVVLVSM